MGAVTWTPAVPSASPQDANAGYEMFGTITMSASYATGGDSITPAQVGLGVISFVEVEAAGGYVLRWNQTNGTIQAYLTGAALSGVLAEAGAGANLSAVVAQATINGY